MEASLPWYARAIRTLEPVFSPPARVPGVRQYLYSAHSGRAESLYWLQRWPEVLQDLDQAVPLADGLNLQRTRTRRAATLAHLGEAAEAAAEADDLARGAGLTSDFLYDLACVYSLSAAAARELSVRHRYAARAVEVLEQAAREGYRDLANMKKDTDLDPIRNRPDFQVLILDLAFPADPLAR
jgi:hypothetical protein